MDAELIRLGRLQAAIRQKLAADAAETNRRMALARAHEAWQRVQAERAASDQALKAEARGPALRTLTRMPTVATRITGPA